MNYNYFHQLLRFQSITFSLILFFLPLLLCSQTPTIQWDKTIGGADLDEFYSLQQTIGGGFILAGYSGSLVSGNKMANSQGGYDYWIVKLDANGNKFWDKAFGGSYSDYLICIEQTNNGGYILGGYSNSPASGNKTSNSKGDFDYWLVELDANGNKTWDRTIGGDNLDELRSIQQTDDGGYIIGGSSKSSASGDKTANSKGDLDYWIIKLDASGNKLWDKTIGGNNEEHLFSLQQTIDGGYILGGYSNSSISGDKTASGNGNYDYWVVKLDANGNKSWDKTIGGSAGDYLYILQQTEDGGYILGGHSTSAISGDKTTNNNGDSDYWLVKLDPNGNKLWDKTIGGNHEDFPYSLKQTADGGYIVGGNSNSSISADKTEDSKGGFDYWLVKLDPNGNKLWDKTVGGSDNDFLRSIQQTTGGGFILGGYSNSPISGNKTTNSNGNFDYWVVKLNAENSCSLQSLKVGFEVLNDPRSNIRVNAKNISTPLILALPDVAFNDGNSYQKSSGIFEVPCDGVYHFDAEVEWSFSLKPQTFGIPSTQSGSISGKTYLIMTINGTISRYDVQPSYSNMSYSQNISVNLSLKAGDKINCSLINGTSAVKSIQHAFFSGFKAY